MKVATAQRRARQQDEEVTTNIFIISNAFINAGKTLLDRISEKIDGRGAKEESYFGIEYKQQQRQQQQRHAADVDERQQSQ